MPAPEDRKTTPVTLAAVNARIDDLRKEVAELVAAIRTQENAAHGALMKTLEDIRLELQAANEDRREMRGQLADHEGRIADLENVRAVANGHG